jgi:hypothetical protein
MIETRCSEQQPEAKTLVCLKFSDLCYDDVDAHAGYGFDRGARPHEA